MNSHMSCASTSGDFTFIHMAALLTAAKNSGGTEITPFRACPRSMLQIT